ncbi:hypothetical protein F9278_04145 [Streptomyces phaeolivaceus]|uniref:Integral membrane protein n=1 Tax=Streptomyces phaeolivaceus TaxID=2653200 RepID=A0A5P8JXT6_9ACTN|nr:hypothetical protein [Streptomyces phaeolivaceus]QFQ95510.1 hypothetical protein F9278_04145 [Streptomyces phaeolivaceus]
MAPGKDSVPPHSGSRPPDSGSGPPDSGPGGAPPPPPAPPHPLSAEERAEYERLRRHAGVRHRRLRKAGAAVLLVVTLLLAPLAVVAAWVQDTVADTDRYVETVAPLASDPAVQQVVINRLTDEVVKNVDVAAVTDALTKVLKDNGAPPAVVTGAGALDGPLRDVVRTVVDRNVTRVVTSEIFRQTWEGANRQAHAAVVHMLTGEREGALRATGDTIQLDLGPVVDQVRERLVDAGFDKAAAIPDTDRTVTLFHTDELGKAQDAMRLLDILGTWLPVLTVALAALTVWTAPGHRVTLLITALGLGLMMVVLLVALAVVRRVYLDAVPSSALPPDAAGAIFDTFLRFLRDSTRTLLVVFLATALAAYLYGPGRVARWVRDLARRGTTAAGRALRSAGLSTGRAGRLLAAHPRWTTGVVLGAGALALLLWNRPTVGAVVLVAVLVVAALALVGVAAAAADPVPDESGLTRPG